MYFKYISNLIKYDTGFKLGDIKSYLEIGVCEGNSAKDMITEFPNIETMVLCDTWRDTFGGSYRLSHDHIKQMLIREEFDISKVEFLDGDSKWTIPLYFRTNEKVFDLVFIDGDHTWEGCLEDIGNCIERCLICAVHDVRHPDHSYLLDLCYDFYDLIKDKFIMIDDGEYLIYFIWKGLFI
jgi:predicted O-methyltransferase YrrM